MFKKLIRDLNKHKYVRIVSYYKNKTMKVSYYKDKDVPKDKVLNPDHMFIFNGYRSFTTHEDTPETLNPLDFKSKYPASHFTTAINSKIVTEAFNSTQKPKLDITTLLLGFNAIGIIVLVYLFLNSQGVI